MPHRHVALGVVAVEVVGVVFGVVVAVVGVVVGVVVVGVVGELLLL